MWTRPQGAPAIALSLPRAHGAFAPNTPEQLMHVMPGGNGRGPMRELARAVELLRQDQ